jgi:hypothetical protein
MGLFGRKKDENYYNTKIWEDFGKNKLKLLEAYTPDVGGGIARIHPDAMRGMNLENYDVIEITGRRSTVVICHADPYPKKVNTIRLDYLTRWHNLGLNDYAIVTVKKMKTIPAEKIMLAVMMVEPFQHTRRDIENIKSNLIGRVFIKSDNIDIKYDQEIPNQGYSVAAVPFQVVNCSISQAELNNLMKNVKEIDSKEKVTKDNVVRTTKTATVPEFAYKITDDTFIEIRDTPLRSE